MKQQASPNSAPSAKDLRAHVEETTGLPRLLNQRELAAYLGKSEAWCERARWAGEGPPWVKLGRHVRYRENDVNTWIDASAVGSSKAAG